MIRVTPIKTENGKNKTVRFSINTTKNNLPIYHSKITTMSDEEIQNYLENLKAKQLAISKLIFPSPLLGR